MRVPPLSLQLLLWLITVSLLPILLLTWAWLNAFEARISDTTERHLSDIADHKATEISEYAAARLRDARLLARSPETHRALTTLEALYQEFGPNSAIYSEGAGEYHDYFARLTNGDHYYDVFLVAPNGEVVFSVTHEADFATNLFTGPYRNTELAAAVRHAVGVLGSEFSDFEFYSPSAAPAAFIAAPVVSGRRLLGAIALQVNPTQIHRVVTDDTGLGDGGSTRVAQRSQNSSDLVYMAPLPQDPGAAFDRTVDAEQAIYEPLRRAVNGERSSGIAGNRDDAVFAAWRYLPSLRWGMVVEVDHDQALAPLHELQAWTLTTLALVIAGVAAAALFLGRAIVRPISQLTSTTTAVAAGNLERRAEVSGFDEARRLARSFNTMTDNLRSAQHTLELRVRQRTTELEVANAQLRQDMEDRARTAAALRQAAQVFDNTSEAILIMRADFRVLSANSAYHEISGYRDEDLLNRPPRFADSVESSQAALEQIREGVRDQGKWSGELLNRRRNGNVFPIWLRVNAVTGEHGEVVNYIAIFSDISHLKQAERRLEQLAYRDYLTGLPNRFLFRERLQQELTNGQRRGTLTGLLFIDLDRFKHINDSFGHEAGDKLLVEVASRLSDCVRVTDTVARLAGDEFTIILGDLHGADSAAHVARTVVSTLSQPFDIDGHEVTIGASLGIAVAPEDGTDNHALVRSADTAMFHAKARGRSTYQFFTEAMNRQNEEWLQIEKQLRTALASGQFELHYQPIIRLGDSAVVGLEVLLRWQHPELGLLGPDRFLPVAEDSGLILPLGEWVLKQTCEQAAAWDRADLAALPLAINLSPRQFLDPELPDRIREVLADTGLEPWRLQLEITEGMTMGEVDEVTATLEQLTAIGLSMTLDRFGSGRSSMALLRRFPVRRIKIDRTLVQDLPDDHDAVAIVTAIIRLSSSLGLEVQAEGIETPAQRELLLKLGCTLAQGHLFSAALNADQIIDQLKR